MFFRKSPNQSIQIYSKNGMLELLYSSIYFMRDKGRTINNISSVSLFNHNPYYAGFGNKESVIRYFFDLIYRMQLPTKQQGSI